MDESRGAALEGGGDVVDGFGDGVKGQVFIELPECFFPFCGYGLAGDLVQGFCEGGYVAGGIEDAAGAASGHHAKGEDVGENGDAAAGHGFADGYAAAFVVRARDDIVGGVEPVLHFVVFLFSDEGDLIAAVGGC